MQIVDFQMDSVRVGRYPVSVDIKAEAAHSNYALSATFYTQRLKTVGDHLPHVEVRKLGSIIKVFVWMWDDHEPIAGPWADSTLIWANVPTLPLIGRMLRMGSAVDRPEYQYSATLHGKTYTILSHERYGDRRRYLCRLEPDDGGPIAEGIISCNKSVKAVGPA